MERQLTMSECCELISELAGDIDGVVYFLNCIREREKKLVIQIDVKNAEIDGLKKVIERKDGAFTQLRVRNTDTGLDHIIGSSQHDVLWVRDGKVKYLNLQDCGSDGDGYRFVEKTLWGDAEP